MPRISARFKAKEAGGNFGELPKEGPPPQSASIFKTDSSFEPAVFNIAELKDDIKSNRTATAKHD